ncbi:AcrZ family multidrug efflux pump-associated protein [Tatumella citrea]|uniref:AcrZ family multidrug efflux pump-associated protein n=1 Tax=Tatumella citrea TaxID=53336 RepID=UPI000B3C967B|nr:AcrZ family multidrug efflux pump-associated protein [Tatumella citrea]
MLELLESLLMAIIMVPIVMALMLGLIYGLGELFNLISGSRRNDQASQQTTHS